MLLTLTTISNASYYSFVKDNNYKLKETFIKEYSEWINIDSEYCESDIAKEDLYYGSGIEGLEVCYQKKERTLSLYEINDEKEKILYSSKIETINEKTSETELFSDHLELSCNNIIVNGYGSTDGIYHVGTTDDNFDVYCDMRENEGWTLLGKVNTANKNSIDEPNNWFINGNNISDILSPNITVNNGLSALGITKINKLSLTNVSEFKLISQSLNQSVNFYKEIKSANISKWFNQTESSSSKVCLDKNLSKNCVDSTFQRTDMYLLSGMNVNKVGFSGADYDIHMRMNSDTASYESGVCSATDNDNNNAWQDSYDSHWGNGLLIYAK